MTDTRPQAQLDAARLHIESLRSDIRRLEADLRRAREESESNAAKHILHGATDGCVCEPCISVRKLIEEATVAAAHVQREAAAKHWPIAFGEDGLDYWKCACGAKFVHGLDWAEHIRNAPLVISPEGEKWLRKRDAAMLLRLMGNENLLAKGFFDDEGDFVAVIVADRTSLEQLAEAQSTGTPE